MPYRSFEFRAGEYYHVYNRGNNFQPVFLEHEDYGYFLRLMRKYLMPEAVEIVSYCLMPNHIHLLVYLKLDNFSSLIKRLALAYTKAINRRYDRAGSLFQGRFRAVHVDRNDYLLHLSRYIHRNPVEAGLVESPENWEYSSYRDFIDNRQGTLPHPEIILSQFGSASNYREFVESYSENDREIIRHLVFD
jgi:REP element-mobilizing transposase RayT